MRILGPVLLALAACGGSDSSGLLGGDPVGRWRELPNLADDDPPPPIEDRAVIEFSADGTYEVTESGDVESGRWSAAGGKLTLTDDVDPGALEIPYAVGERFVLGALTPDGAADGPFGTWTTTNDTVDENEQPITVTMTLEIAADGTGSLAYDRSSGEDELYDATWTRVQDDFRLTVMPSDNVTVNMHFSYVEGVIGTPFERI